MKNFCKSLSTFILFIGIIGSLCCAIVFGKRMNFASLKLERDWIMSSVLFASIFISALVLYAILNSLSEIIERQELICEALNIDITEKNSPVTVTPRVNDKVSVDNLSKNKLVPNEDTSPTWDCSNCKCTNTSANTFCKACGKPRL